MGEELIVEIVEQVADAKGVDPLELDTPLQEYIDVLAVERLAAHEGSTWTLSFELPDHDVTVTDAGAVLVDEL